MTIRHAHHYAIDYSTVDVQPIGQLVTHLYDKRRGSAYRGINIPRYPDASSDLIAGSKYGIFTMPPFFSGNLQRYLYGVKKKGGGEREP